jgi:hypothetical protein
MGQLFYGLRSVPLAFGASAGCYYLRSSPAFIAASSPMWSTSGLLLLLLVFGRVLVLLGVVSLGPRR